MNDSDNDDYQEDERNEEGEAPAAEKKPRPKPTPLLVQYMNSNATSAMIMKLIKLSVETYPEDSEAPPIVEDTEDEEPMSEEEAQKSENERVYSLSQLSHMRDEQGRNLFQWAVDNGHFLLVEKFIQYGLRLTGLTPGGDNKLNQALEVNERWTQERQRVEDELIEKLKSEEEEEEDDLDQDQDVEPEPDFAQSLADELEIPVQRARRIGDMGVYSGSMNENGLKNGYGVSLYPNEDIYVGQHKNGFKHGKGAYMYKTKKNKKNIVDAFYCGEWENNMKNGKGYQLYPNGNRYYGGWKDNQMHGQAKMTYLNGDSYIGEFQSGVKCGQGEYHFRKDGSRYIGQFEEGKLHQGVWDCNAFIYRGQFDSTGVPCLSALEPSAGVLEFPKSRVSQRGAFTKEHEFKVLGDLQDLI